MRPGAASLAEEAAEEARSVGAELAAARERLGWSLPDIAAHLRIRQPYLAAIEQGRLEELPGNAYALGFVRTYAPRLVALGLGDDTWLESLLAELDSAERGEPDGAFFVTPTVLEIVAARP